MNEESKTNTGANLGGRLEVACTRSKEIAETTSTRARQFVHDHPVAAAAGGIVAGAIVAGLLARRRHAKAADVIPKLPQIEAAVEAGTSRLGHIATIGAELALAYAARATEAGKESVHKIEESVGTLGEAVGEKSAEAGKRVADLADVAIEATRDAGKALLKRLGERTETKGE